MASKMRAPFNVLTGNSSQACLSFGGGGVPTLATKKFIKLRSRREAASVRLAVWQGNLPSPKFDESPELGRLLAIDEGIQPWLGLLPFTSFCGRSGHFIVSLAVDLAVYA